MAHHTDWLYPPNRMGNTFHECDLNIMGDRRSRHSKGNRTQPVEWEKMFANQVFI